MKINKKNKNKKIKKSLKNGRNVKKNKILQKKKAKKEARTMVKITIQKTKEKLLVSSEKKLNKVLIQRILKRVLTVGSFSRKKKFQRQL